jgi:hypothetical protein
VDLRRLMQTWARLTRPGVIACGLLALIATAAPAQPMRGDLRTNESEIVALLRSSPLAIDDPVAVLAFVMGQLPERVQVYPSENYYYFRFVHNGVEYDGNIRLAAADRDQGVLKFAYFERSADWIDKPAGRYASLGAAEGVMVEKVAPLTYRVTLNQSVGGKTVTFALNDLSQVAPPQGLLGSDEKFLGATFDESGIRFLLVFNTKLKIFHFLLDETVSVADGLVAAAGSDRILIGKRTGFAFYQYRGRKILIGVSARQSQLNTSYDGPFDQLPENFIEGEALREAIVAADPRVKGRIDRLGNYLSGDARYLIHPYLPYQRVADLRVFHRCATSRSVAEARRPLCFVVDDGEAQRPNPRPLALKRR